jgi:hypothetical protein
MLYPVWLFLSAIFFYYAYINWRQAQSSLREFQFRQKEGEEAPREVDARRSSLPTSTATSRASTAPIGRGIAPRPSASWLAESWRWCRCS